MIARVAIYLALALALLALGVLGAGYWLLHTDSGSGWLWDTATAAVPGKLAAAGVEGSLADGLHLEGVSYDNASMAVAVADAELALDLDLFPLAVNVVRLAAADVVVRQRAQPPRDDQRRFSLESLRLPVEIDIRAMNITDLRVLNADDDPLLEVVRAELAGSWHEAVVLSRLDIDASTMGVDGAAALSLQEPFDASASFTARYPLRLGADVVPLDVAVTAAGDLEHLRINLTSDDPNLVVEGELRQVMDELQWNLRAKSNYLQWPLTGDSANLRLRDVILDSRGGLSDYSVTAGGMVTAIAEDALQFSLDADGDRDGLDVNRLRLQGPMLLAQSTGELRWRGGFAVTADADIERFDPAVLTAEWPAATPVNGTAQAGWSAGKLELDDLRLRVGETAQAVDAAGLIDLDRGVVDLHLDWRDLRWPVAAKTYRFRSEFGKVAVTGKPESWALDGRIAFKTPELPQGTFELSGTGNREQAALTLEDSQVFGGKVAGRIRYNWRDGGRWSAALTAERIDTGAVALQWPGRISADFNASGQVKPLQIAVDIDRLSGVIRERPVAGSGGFRYANGNLAVQQLQLSSGDSRLQANGSLRGEDGLDFTVDVVSLAGLLRDAAGSLQADGNVAMDEGFPELRMNLDGRDLAWREYRLEMLSITTRDSGPAPLALTADGHGAEAGGLQLQEFTLELEGREDRQQLALQATLDEKQVEIALDGRLADWRRPLESGWAGELTAFRFELPEGPGFALEEPADLRLDPGDVALERACLHGDAAAQICLEGRRTGPSEFNVAAELTAVPVNLAKMLLDTELEFTQTLDGSLAISNARGSQLSALARIDIAPGQIRNPHDKRMAMHTGAGEFNLDLDDGRALLARLNLPFSQAAAIDAEFVVADVTKGSDSRIDGDLTMDLNDIGVVAGIVPTIERASGRVDIDIALAGTIADPVFSGGASLKNGALNYAPLGLKLTDIELTSGIQEDNRINLQSTFRAGDGVGRISSSTNALGSIGDAVRLRLTGENLTIIDLPQINVVANMDVNLGVTPDELSIDGDVLIPRARLSPREITSTQVTESEDVVIVASRNGEEETQAQEPSTFAVTGQADLTLGKDVIVDFDAAETRLNGAVSFVWDGPPMPAATGEYKVTGKFEAYGQLLEITEGSIRFPGVPADNPQLRIRAEREIFGNPRIRSAGVLVSGTAKDPELEVYTNPATNKERALMMLVTGSDFSYEQGVGAVDVGTYIAPDLYLSYGIGLFDRENVISVRYDLTRGFGIKATSGKRAEGVDLSYTFER